MLQNHVIGGMRVTWSFIENLEKLKGREGGGKIILSSFNQYFYRNHITVEHTLRETPPQCNATTANCFQLKCSKTHHTVMLLETKNTEYQMTRVRTEPTLMLLKSSGCVCFFFFFFKKEVIYVFGFNKSKLRTQKQTATLETV